MIKPKLLSEFERCLRHIYLRTSYDSNRLNDLSFINSLAYHSYELILRLLSMKHCKESENILQKIYNSIQLFFDENFPNTIRQLFNQEKYNKLYTFLHELNNKEYVSRSRRFVVFYSTTTVKPFIPDDVKKVYIGELPSDSKKKFSLRVVGV
ncbi:uncharacterized protein VNE69_03159 [Vairimorpha necatrix]